MPAKKDNRHRQSRLGTDQRRWEMENPELVDYMPDEQELADGKEVFLQAAKRMGVHKPVRPQHVQINRLAGAAGAALLFMVLAIGSVLINASRVESRNFRGFQGVVVSMQDARPVPNVFVYQADTEGERLYTKTDAAGVFEIMPGKECAEYSYVLRYDNQRVGIVHTGLESNLARGYRRIEIDAPAERISDTWPVVVSPGYTLYTRSGLELSLLTGADEWSGTLTENHQWPGNFVWGKVINGVFEVSGNPSPYLILSYRIDQELLDLYGISADEVRIAAFDEEYKQNDEEWRRFQHRGWYDATQIEDEYLERHPGLRRLQTSVTQTDDGAIVSWPATPGVPYALLAPVDRDGELVVHGYNWIAASEQYTLPSIGFMDYSRVQPWLHDYSYLIPGDDEPYYVSGHMRREPKYRFHLVKEEPDKTGNWTQNHNPNYGNRVFTQFSADESNVSGLITVSRYDFTLSNPQMFETNSPEVPDIHGTYDVKVDQLELGEVSRLTLTGNRRFVEGVPRWDFYCDGVIDAYGFEADLLITHNGEFSLEVELTEKNGSHIVVHRTLNLPGPNALGVSRYFGNSVPLYESLDYKPSEEFTRRVVSHMAFSSPMPASYGYGVLPGGFWVINPPSEFRGAPLKELRIYTDTKGIIGDYAEMEIYGLVHVHHMVPSEHPGSQYEFIAAPEFSVYTRLLSRLAGNFSEYRLDRCHPDYRFQRAKTYIDRGEVERGRQYVLDHIALTEKHFNYTVTKYKLLYNADILGLPTGEEFVDLVDRITSDRFFCLNYASSERSMLESYIPLDNGVLTDNMVFTVGYMLCDEALPETGQWDLYSGGDDPARIELETTDGRVFTQYMDYNLVD